MRRITRRMYGLSSERGAALVEFALVVPFLMLMMCATIDFGLAVYTLNNLTAAAREGGRYAATLTFGWSAGVQTTATATADSQAVVDRTYAFIANMNSANLTAAQVKAKITVEKPVVANGNIITVRITAFPYNPVTPLAPLLGLTTINMNRTSIFRWERSS
jgi:Flp pilus assembly protein TadG